MGANKNNIILPNYIISKIFLYLSANLTIDIRNNIQIFKIDDLKKIYHSYNSKLLDRPLSNKFNYFSTILSDHSPYFYKSNYSIKLCSGSNFDKILLDYQNIYQEKYQISYDFQYSKLFNNDKLNTTLIICQ